MLKKFLFFIFAIHIPFCNTLCSDGKIIEELNEEQLREYCFDQAKIIDATIYNEMSKTIDQNTGNLKNFMDLFLKKYSETVTKEYLEDNYNNLQNQKTLENLTLHIKSRQNKIAITKDIKKFKEDDKKLLKTYYNPDVFIKINKIMSTNLSAYEKIKSIEKTISDLISSDYKESKDEKPITRMGRVECQEIQQKINSQKAIPPKKSISQNEQQALKNFSSAHKILLNKPNTIIENKENHKTTTENKISEVIENKPYIIKVTDSNAMILNDKKSTLETILQTIENQKDNTVIDYENPNKAPENDKKMTQITTTKNPSRLSNFFNNSFSDWRKKNFGWRQKNRKSLILVASLISLAVLLKSGYKNKNSPRPSL